MIFSALHKMVRAMRMRFSHSPNKFIDAQLFCCCCCCCFAINSPQFLFNTKNQHEQKHRKCACASVMAVREEQKSAPRARAGVKRPSIPRLHSISFTGTRTWQRKPFSIWQIALTARINAKPECKQKNRACARNDCADDDDDDGYPASNKICQRVHRHTRCTVAFIIIPVAGNKLIKSNTRKLLVWRWQKQ